MYCFIVLWCVFLVPRPYMIYFIVLWHSIACLCWKCPLNTNELTNWLWCCVLLKLLKLARTKRLSPATVKCRLAGRLGIGLPQAGRQIPTMVKSSSSSGFVESRAGSSDVGTGGLSIMGSRDDLDPFRFVLLICIGPCAGSGVVGIDPLHLLVGCQGD